MLLRRAAWRLAGRTTGRRLPAAAGRGYYRLVAGSLARALAAADGVLAVYAWGSFATGAIRPGHSDVDLLVVLEDLEPADEVVLLAELRARYVRRQAVLPIDLTALARSELARDAGCHELLRLRAADARPGLAPAAWRLLAGADVRPPAPAAPDPALRYVSDVRVQGALAAAAAGHPRAARALVARLDEDAALDGPHRAAAGRLRAARRAGDDLELLHAALTVVDEHRARHAVAAPSATGLAAEAPDDRAMEAARPLATTFDSAARSLTLHRPVFGGPPALVVECPDLEGAREALRQALAGGAADAARRGLRLEILTTRLAEDAWRSRALRGLSLTGGAHVGGDPLAPRLRAPEDGERRVARYGAVTAVALARWAALGRRGFAPDPSLPRRVAAARALAAGEPPPATAPGGLREVLELWRS